MPIFYTKMAGLKKPGTGKIKNAHRQ